MTVRKLIEFHLTGIKRPLFGYVYFVRAAQMKYLFRTLSMKYRTDARTDGRVVCRYCRRASRMTNSYGILLFFFSTSEERKTNTRRSSFVRTFTYRPKKRETIFYVIRMFRHLYFFPFHHPTLFRKRVYLYVVLHKTAIITILIFPAR